MSFVSNIVGGILGANAAGNAASVESSAAKQAQNLELQNQQAANTFQGNVWTGTQGAEAPYQSLGASSANQLQSLLGTGFQAPTLAQAEQTPGYQFQLQQGTQAIDQNAAANGTLMSGNTGVALQNYGQGLAQNAYQQTYNNALNQYMANYQSLLGGTQTGLSSTGQLASAGQAAAGNTANIDLTGAQQQAQQINNAAAATASGYLGEARGYGQMAGGIMSGIGSIFGGPSLSNISNTVGNWFSGGGSGSSSSGGFADPANMNANVATL